MRTTHDIITDVTEKLSLNGRRTDDIEYVNHDGGHCTWDAFCVSVHKIEAADFNVYYIHPTSMFQVVGKGWLLHFNHNWQDEHYSDWRFVEFSRHADNVVPTKESDLFVRDV